jgi:uncharacterized membrane protein YccC
MEAAFDTHAAALAAVRVFVAVGLAAVFWIATAWPAGDKCLVWAGLASCRYAITPDPARATQATLKGMIFAAAPALRLPWCIHIRPRRTPNHLVENEKRSRAQR